MSDPIRPEISFYPWEQSMPDRAARPTNPFIPFPDSEIEQSIPQRFEKVVERHAVRLAVKDAQHAFTYDELNQLANRIAWAILAEGKAPTVALVMDQGALAIAVLLGAIKAGKAYVPLDPTYPPARLEYMLHDCQANVILSDRANLSLAGELAAGKAGPGSGGSVNVLCVPELDAGLSTGNPGLDISPDAYAYILYTSGTTGQPKGVLGDHRQVMHFTKVFINSFHTRPEDRVSLLSALSFSGSLAYIFPTLLNGSALFPFDVKKGGPAQLAHWLIDERITLYGSVPTLLRQICASLTGNETFPDLRIVRVGGDRVEKGDLELCKKYFGPNFIFRAGYGATEAKIITQHFMNKDSQIDGIMPVGYPVEDVEVLLLDKAGRPVELGEVGEIAVRSRYLAPGYWQRPEETQASFLPDPDGGDQRIYLTGDLGCMSADGCLTHLGRKDFQVKVRGYRIEIAEIEAALLDLEQVKEAVVDLRDGPDGEPQLVGYLVLQRSVGASQLALTTSSLRRALGERLPDYMIPSIFVMLDEMPLNVNGKIDRRALPTPEFTRPELENPYVAPRDELERDLVHIWEGILGVQPVGVHDNFYELGGHSLLVARLFAQIETELGRDGHGELTTGTLALGKFFRSPTVEQLASILREASLDDSKPRAKSGGKPQRDGLLVALKNRAFQVLALYAPGAKTVRVWLHRLRGVQIGQDVFIGLGVILESEYPWMVSIGEHVTISVRSVVIAHFKGTARKAKLNREPSVRIESNVFIGPGVIILPNVTIGEGAVVAAGSIVNQSVPPMTMVQGNPARPVARCGIPLVGNAYEQFMRYLEPIDG